MPCEIQHNGRRCIGRRIVVYHQLIRQHGLASDACKLLVYIALAVAACKRNR